MRSLPSRTSFGVILFLTIAACAIPLHAQPDVIVAELPSVVHYGPVGTVHSYAVGTTSCNIGNDILLWESSNNQHPVITQNAFMLVNDRFTQIGQGWLKHGFCALSGTVCGPCNSTPCDTLGVGCSDPYSASLNGSQGGLGPKSDVNATTGVFPYPFTNQGSTGNDIYKRIQIEESDLTITGARYFVNSHYVTPDEPPHGTDMNNESYREVTISGSFGMNVSGPTVREKAAIEAWKDIDASVTLTIVDVPGDGRYYVAAKAVPDGPNWRYEYAIQNYNSKRAADGLSIPVPAAAVISAIGFQDIDYHSGEIYSNVDWSFADNGTSVDWASPETFAQNPNTNALRWDTLYNFWFTSDLPPTSGAATLDLFEPGSPGSVSFVTVVPGTTGSPPFNDDCANAITASEGSTGFSTANATTDGPNESCGAIASDVWYRYTPPCDGDATIGVCGASFDTQLAVYLGGCPGGAPVACNDDACGSQSEVTVAVTGGSEYWIRIGGPAQGNGQLTIVDPVCGGGGGDANDNCADAIALEDGVPVDGSTTNANNDGTASCASSAGSPDVWYTYTPTISETVSISTCDSANYDTALAIFDGCGGTQLACLDDTTGCAGFTQTLDYDMTAGVTYWIRVSGYNNASGDFTLTVTGGAGGGGGGPTGPTNDNCQDREGVGLGSLPFDTTDATTDGPTHPECSFFSYDDVGSDIWFNYPSTFNGEITISLCGSNYDTKLAVYEGNGCDNFETRIMDCNDDSCDLQSELTIPVVIGENYTIRIGGYNGATGTGTLTITGNPDDSCTLVTDGLVLQLESDLGLNASGSTVTGWSDQSASGNDLSPVGAPTVITAATNGRDAVRFDGVDDRLERVGSVVGLPTGNADRSVFIVASYANATTPTFAYGSAGCGNSFGVGVAGDGDLATDDGCTIYDTITAGNGAGWLVQSAIVASGTLRHYAGGAQIDSYSTAYTTTAGAIALGTDFSGAAASELDVAAVLVYDRALTEAERAQVEGYLALKYFGTACDTNLPPFADDDFTAVDQGDTVLIDVLANDTDSDGSIDASSVVMVTAPDHGSISINGTTGVITYVHDDSATTADAFVYRVSDTLGRASNDAIVSISINPCVPPAFTLNPVGGTYCANGSVTLSVTAAGDGPISYQWRKNGAMLSGETNATLTMDNVSNDDAGSYDCVATNSCGTATSAAAVVAVDALAAITQQPMSQSSCEGGSITLTTAATGAGPLAYQWRKNGSNIPGATSPTLELTSLTAADAGNYDCSISNNCNKATTTTAVVMVDAPAQIVSQPASATGCEGSSVTLSVAATGAGPIAYQWRKDGSAIAGATGTSLTLASLTASDAGNYDCVATGACGSSTSDQATIEVWSAPTISASPSGGTECEGSSLTMSVSASSNLALSYQWRRNGVNVAGATGSSLTLNPLTAGDAGNYDCLVSNACGSTASGTAVVSVLVAPSITGAPSDASACEGGNASFTVGTTGSASLTYQWRRDGSAIAGATGSSLNLSGVTAADAGLYDCVVTNGCGSATSASAELTITEAPVITGQPTSQSGCVGASVSLSVASSGAALDYQWRRNGVALGGATGAILTLSSLDLADAGSYDCVVSNGCGSDTSAAASVSVIDAPSIDASPASVSECTGASVTLDVSASSSIAVTYQWRKDGVAIPGATGSSYTLASLSAGDAGNYDCVASNSCGSTTSGAATVTVETGPSITAQPADTTGCLGGDATFSVGADDADSYQWRKDGTPIAGATSDSLTVTGIDAGDAGSYDVVVTNGCGDTTSAAASLSTTDVPVVTVSPTDTTTCEGFDVTLFGAATSDSSLSYQWLLDGVTIPGATTSALTLTAVTAADAGVYEVRFLNECGFVTGTPATLTVTAADTCDCNANGVLDGDEIAGGTAEDCNANGIPDECDIASGTSADVNSNGVPDECEPVGFVRGDGNADGVVNLADAIFLLAFFFNGGTAPSCDDAADVNDDTLTNLADAIYVLDWQFNEGPEPPAPFPSCGVDPTDNDSLGCASYTSCP